jgi:hypothetical protein
MYINNRVAIFSHGLHAEFLIYPRLAAQHEWAWSSLVALDTAFMKIVLVLLTCTGRTDGYLPCSVDVRYSPSKKV